SQNILGTRQGALLKSSPATIPQSHQTPTPQPRRHSVCIQSALQCLLKVTSSQPIPSDSITSYRVPSSQSHVSTKSSLSRDRPESSIRDAVAKIGPVLTLPL